MPGPEDPDRPSGISPYRCLCIGFRCVKTVAVCIIAFTRLYQTSGCAVSLPAYRVPCVRFTCFVRCSDTSSTDATLGTGGWLDLTRWGLPPHKKRQASLGALTQRSHCALCERETVHPNPPAPVPPDPMPPTNRRLRTVDISMHFCPHTDCDYRGWLGLNNLRANGHPSGGPWRQFQCTWGLYRVCVKTGHNGTSCDCSRTRFTISPTTDLLTLPCKAS